ncbi:MAG: outer membrane lipoprotein-sorting protein [Candidatus Margulisbacteria bacterium]|nr:outer membrane lipoprotein-sorting protein [Candidatus Margulisiibacteriota bacterium]MBU1617494.1 outer membrane lipoprotein-sorting protein [Candidatus Margulisiibacteriota bacterium]
MNRTAIILALFWLTSGTVFAVTGAEIIKKVDENMTFKTAKIEAEMVIHIDKEVRTKTMRSYQMGRDTSFSVFLSPPRDKGVKYLKIKDNMWMYLPTVDKTIKIAGHMLRQSMMGSDFSYEDALESGELLDKYTATLVSEEVVKQRPCYVIDLTARVKEITYYRRLVWVDQELFVPVREELFALSGKKLKSMTMGNIQKYGGRYYPLYMSMRNLLRRNTLTEMIITKAEFDLSLPAEMFTQRSLTK